MINNYDNMNWAKLDLDENNFLILKCNFSGIEKITRKAYYKIKLKRYVSRITDFTIEFKPTLGYIQYEKIDEIFVEKTKNEDFFYLASENLKLYVESKKFEIASRSRIGNEIKKQSSKYNEQFELFSKTVDELMVRKLRTKQKWDSFFMYVMQRSANFSVPGSGKTSAVLGMYAYLKAQGKVDKLLVVGPKNSFESWKNEFNSTFGYKEVLNCFDKHSAEVIRMNISQTKTALKLDTGNCNMFLFNYESLKNYKDELIEIVNNKTLLVFDEVHKIKRIGGEYALPALDIARNSIYTVALTGTPIPNSYKDIYNLLHILYNDEYKDFFRFDESTLNTPDEEDIEIINRKIQPFFCRTTKEELNVPKANEDIYINCQSNSKEQRLFELLISKYRKNHLTLFIRILQLESDSKLLLEAIDKYDFSYIFDVTKDEYDMEIEDLSDEFEELANGIPVSTKKAKCLELVNSLTKENKKVIVWCIFKRSIEDLTKRLKSMGIKAEYVYGDLDQTERTKRVRNFQNGKIDVLITNPHTLGESISLHKLCHDAVYFEYSYNLVHLLQSKDRIHRLGLLDNQYTQYYYLQSKFQNKEEPYSLDVKVYNRLMEKENDMLNAIENDKFEHVSSSEEDLEKVLKGLF